MHFVIIGGDGVQLLGGYIPPIPPPPPPPFRDRCTESCNNLTSSKHPRSWPCQRTLKLSPDSSTAPQPEASQNKPDRDSRVKMSTPKPECAVASTLIYKVCPRVQCRNVLCRSVLHPSQDTNRHLTWKFRLVQCGLEVGRLVPPPPQPMMHILFNVYILDEFNFVDLRVEGVDGLTFFKLKVFLYRTLCSTYVDKISIC